MKLNHAPLQRFALKLTLTTLCAFATATSAYAQPLTVSQFRKLAPARGEYQLRGFIVKHYQCPPCPPDSECKPCMPNNVLVGETSALQTSFPAHGEFVVVLTDRTEELQLGKEYTLPIEVLPQRSFGYGVNDVRLVPSGARTK